MYVIFFLWKRGIRAKKCNKPSMYQVQKWSESTDEFSIGSSNILWLRKSPNIKYSQIFLPKAWIFFLKYFLAVVFFQTFPLALSEINLLTWITFLSLGFYPATSFVFPHFRCILESYPQHPVNANRIFSGTSYRPKTILFLNFSRRPWILT